MLSLPGNPKAKLQGTLASPTARGIAAILGGTAGGQLLIACSLPILSRIYAPSTFGLFAIALSAIVTLATISSLRYELAVPIASDRSGAVDLAWLSFLCIILTSTTLLLVSIIWSTEIASGLNAPELAPVLWMVPTASAILAGFQLMNQLAIRDRRYAASAKRSVLSAAGTAIGQISLGIIGVGFTGLIVGYAMGQLAGLLTLAFGSMIRPARGLMPRLWHSAKRYRRFPLIAGPSALLNVASLQLPIVALGVLFGTADAGYFGMTQRALGLPMALVGMAIGQVYLGEMSRLIRDDAGSATITFAKASRALFAIGIIATIPVLGAGPWIFSTFLGPDWSQSGAFAQAMSISFLAQLVASPLASTLVVLEKQVLLLKLDAVRLALNIGSMLAVASLGGSALQAIWALGTSSAFTYLLYWRCSRSALSEKANTLNSPPP